MPVNEGPEAGEGAITWIAGKRYQVGPDGKWPKEAADHFAAQARAGAALEGGPSAMGNPYVDKPGPVTQRGPPVVHDHRPAAWSPERPPDRLLRRLEDVDGWARWLVDQGYGPREAADLFLAPDARARLQAWETQQGRRFDTAEELDTLAGAIVLELERNPPKLLDKLDTRPALVLSPEAWGARLVDRGAAGELGARVFVDLVDGSRHWARQLPVPGLSVIAGALYGLLEVAAVAPRLAVVRSRTWSVHPEPRAWTEIDGDAPARWALEYAPELPADAWLGNRNQADSLRQRTIRLPPGICRYDLATCCTFLLSAGAAGRSLDRLLEGEGAIMRELAEPARLVPKLLEPMATRLEEVTDDQLREAVDLGRLTDQDRARLLSALIARRAAVLERVRSLISSAASGA